jgi:HAMP domain-containing protein
VAEVLWSFLVLTLVFVVVSASILLVTHRSARRHNLVSRRFPTKAPLRWLASPSSWAALHRRLRDAITVMRAAVPPVKSRRRQSELDLSPLNRLADEIEQHAAALDHDLIVAVHYRGPTRSALRRRLTGQVLELERLAHRVAAAATAASPARPGAMPTPEAISRIGGELDALEAARDEIARLEADVGLTWVPRQGS